MENNFKIGDQVKLKSGSYPMTINAFEEHGERIHAVCVLIDRITGNAKREAFDIDALFKIDDD